MSYMWVYLLHHRLPTMKPVCQPPNKTQKKKKEKKKKKKTRERAVKAMASKGSEYVK